MPHSRWTQQVADEATTVSAGIKYDLNTVGGSGVLGAGVMQLWGGDGQDKGYLASTSSSKFEGRYRLHRAIKVSYGHDHVRLLGRTFKSFASATYDFLQNGAMVKLMAGTEWWKKYFVYLSADFLGIVNQSSVVKENGFLRQYRANDQVQLGMSYVF